MTIKRIEYMLLDEVLAETRRLCSAASAERWYAGGHDVLRDIPSSNMNTSFTTIVGRQNFPNDAAFIAVSRQLVPQLCDEVERLQEEVKHLRAQLSAASGTNAMGEPIL